MCSIKSLMVMSRFGGRVCGWPLASKPVSTCNSAISGRAFVEVARAVGRHGHHTGRAAVSRRVLLQNLVCGTAGFVWIHLVALRFKLRRRSQKTRAAAPANAYPGSRNIKFEPDLVHPKLNTHCSVSRNSSDAIASGFCVKLLLQ